MSLWFCERSALDSRWLWWMCLCRHWVARILEDFSDSLGSHILYGSISSFQISFFLLLLFLVLSAFWILLFALVHSTPCDRTQTPACSSKMPFLWQRLTVKIMLVQSQMGHCPSLVILNFCILKMRDYTAVHFFLLSTPLRDDGALWALPTSVWGSQQD